MADLGTLQVSIGANTSGLENGAARARTSMQRLGDRAARVGKAMAKMGAAASVAGAAMTAALVRRGLTQIDTQAKLARSIGATNDGLRAVRLAASDAGVGASIIDDALEKLNSRLGEAERGTGRAAEALEKLGLDARDLGALDADERMAALADRVQELGLTTAQTSDILRSLGIRNLELVNILNQGGDAMRNARDEVQDFGLSLSNVDAAQVEAANDAMSRIKFVVERLANTLAVELAPILDGIARSFNSSAKSSEGFGSSVGNAVDFAIAGIAGVSDVIDVMDRAWFASTRAVAVFGLQVVRDMQEAAAAILQGPVSAINALIRQMNRVGNLAGFSIDEIQTPDIVTKMRENVERAEAAVALGVQEIRDRLAEPLPSQGIVEWVQNTRMLSEQRANQVVADREREAERVREIQQRMNQEGAELTAEEMQQNLEANQQKLLNLDEFLATSLEKEQIAHEERMQWLEDAREAELIGEKEFQNRKEQLKDKHLDKINDMQKKSDGERVKQNKRDQDQMVATTQRALGLVFGESKAAAIAQALLAARESIVNAYNWGSRFGGPGAGAAAAGVAAAATAKQVSAVRSTGMGGGGTPTSNAQESVSFPTQQEERGQNVNLTISGGDKLTRAIAQSINTAVEDGVNLRVK